MVIGRVCQGAQGPIALATSGPRPPADSYSGEPSSRELTLDPGGMGTGTWEGHQHVAVLCGHRLHPCLVGHQVPTHLQEPLPKKLIWGAGRAGWGEAIPGSEPWPPVLVPPALAPDHTLARAPRLSAWHSRPCELWSWLVSFPPRPCTSQALLQECPSPRSSLTNLTHSRGPAPPPKPQSMGRSLADLSASPHYVSASS